MTKDGLWMNGREFDRMFETLETSLSVDLNGHSCQSPDARTLQKRRNKDQAAGAGGAAAFP